MQYHDIQNQSSLLQALRMDSPKYESVGEALMSASRLIGVEATSGKILHTMPR